jgi:hypothetical protein
MNRNLVGSIIGRSSIKIANLVSIRYQTCPSQSILVSDWSIFKKSSPLKPLVQMSRNLVESIYWRTMEGSVLSFLKAEWKVSDTEPLVFFLFPVYLYIFHFGKRSSCANWWSSLLRMKIMFLYALEWNVVSF